MASDTLCVLPYFHLVVAALEEADRVGVPLLHMPLFVREHWLKAIALKEIVITRPYVFSLLCWIVY